MRPKDEEALAPPGRKWWVLVARFRVIGRPNSGEAHMHMRDAFLSPAMGGALWAGAAGLAAIAARRSSAIATPAVFPSWAFWARSCSPPR